MRDHHSIFSNSALQRERSLNEMRVKLRIQTVKILLLHSKTLLKIHLLQDRKGTYDQLKSTFSIVPIKRKDLIYRLIRSKLTSLS